MFRNESKHQSSGAGTHNFTFDISLIICEFMTQMSRDLIDFLPVFDKLDPTEDNYTANVQSPLAFTPEALIVNAE